MFWIRNFEGDLCNLARATDLIISHNAAEQGEQAGKYCLQAVFDGALHPNITPIAYGSPAELRKIRDDILAKLIRHQNARLGIDEPAKLG